MDIKDMYEFATSLGIETACYPLDNIKSMSTLDGTDCYIALNTAILESEADDLCSLAHEVGHCVKGAFYNIFSRFDVVRKHEKTARKWAAQALVSKMDLEKALSWGEPYETVANDLGVTLDVLQDAMAVYFG